MALWATQQLLPLTEDGAFARGLRRGREAALELDRRIRKVPSLDGLAHGGPELDIVVWKPADLAGKDSSQLAQDTFVACAARDLHLALVQLPQLWFEPEGDEEPGTGDGLVTCLRSVLMKPEHEAWLDRIWERLTAATAEVMGE